MMYRASSETATWQFFWYEKNLQGDVVAVYDNNGVKHVSYTYDAWGNTTETRHVNYTAASYNPFRYRRYYYDRDIGLYCLGTRWYSTQFRRFLSPDNVDVTAATPGGLTDKNLYAYCDNNPVMRVDYTGEFWISAMLIGAAIGIAAQYATDIITNIINGETGSDLFTTTSSWQTYLAAGVGGALAAIPVSGLFGTMLTGAIGNIASDAIKGNISSWQDTITSGLLGAFANGFGYYVSKSLAKIKAKSVLSMSRAKQKTYLTDTIYKNRRAYANANFRTFADNPVGTIEKQFFAFNRGIYSTLSSTLGLSVYGGVVAS